MRTKLGLVLICVFPAVAGRAFGPARLRAGNAETNPGQSCSRRASGLSYRRGAAPGEVLHGLPWPGEAEGRSQPRCLSGRELRSIAAQDLGAGPRIRRGGAHAARRSPSAESRGSRPADGVDQVGLEGRRLRPDVRPRARDDPPAQPGRIQQHDPRPDRYRLSSADDFPSDDVGYGFDNIGDVLSMPPILMEKYLAAAEKISEEAIVTGAVGEGTGQELESESLGCRRGGLAARRWVGRA